MRPDNVVSIAPAKKRKKYDVPTMVTIQEAADITGLTYSFIYKGCKNGTIVHVKSGKKNFVNLDRLIDQLNGLEAVKA